MAGYILHCNGGEKKVLVLCKGRISSSSKLILFLFLSNKIDPFVSASLDLVRLFAEHSNIHGALLFENRFWLKNITGVFGKVSCIKRIFKPSSRSLELGRVK